MRRAARARARVNDELRREVARAKRRLPPPPLIAAAAHRRRRHQRHLVVSSSLGHSAARAGVIAVVVAAAVAAAAAAVEPIDKTRANEPRQRRDARTRARASQSPFAGDERAMTLHNRFALLAAAYLSSSPSSSL